MVVAARAWPWRSSSGTQTALTSVSVSEVNLIPAACSSCRSLLALLITPLCWKQCWFRCHLVYFSEEVARWWRWLSDRRGCGADSAQSNDNAFTHHESDAVFRVGVRVRVLVSLAAVGCPARVRDTNVVAWSWWWWWWWWWWWRPRRWWWFDFSWGRRHQQQRGRGDREVAATAWLGCSNAIWLSDFLCKFTRVVRGLGPEQVNAVSCAADRGVLAHCHLTR